MKVSEKKYVVAGIAALAMVGVSGQALAAGFMLREQSSEYLGNAFAGSAAKASSPATVWYNPAGMTMLAGHQIAGSLTWIAPQARFSGTGNYTGGQGGDAISDALVGSNFAMYSVSNDLKLGIAVVSPFGLRSSYPSDWLGRRFGTAGAVTDINVNPNVAYRINKNLSIGAGLQFDWAEVDISSVPANHVSVTSSYGRVKGDGIGVGWNVGALWEFSPATRVGLAYRSGMRHNIEGTQTVIVNSTVNKFDVHADLTLPATATASFHHDIDEKWSVMGDVQWTNWSILKDLSVYNNAGTRTMYSDYSWRDTWFFSLGTDYRWAKGHTLHLGVAYDMGAVKDAQHRSVLVPDSDRYWLAAGYTWDYSEKLRLNVGYAHLFAPEADIDAAAALTASPPANDSTMTGKYNASVDIFSTSFVYKF